MRACLGLLTERFGPPREPEGEITQHHKDIAAALQSTLQACQMHVLRHFKAETGQTRLCLAGGVALNCSFNGALRRSRVFQRLFVQPAAGDDGSALGAALFASQLHDPAFKPRKMAVPLWGPEFGDCELEHALNEQEVPVLRSDLRRTSRPPSTVHRPPSTVGRRRTVDCGLWTVDCGLWTVDCRRTRVPLWSGAGRLHSASYAGKSRTGLRLGRSSPGSRGAWSLDRVRWEAAAFSPTRATPA